MLPPQNTWPSHETAHGSGSGSGFASASASASAPAPAPAPGVIFTVGRALLRPLLLLRYRPRVTGRERVPATGAVLLVSNHLSALDTVLIPTFSPRKVQFLAKASLFRSALGGWFFRSIGAIPVHRDAGATAQAALLLGREVLGNGSVFAVFPEGSRSRDGRLYRGRSGAAWLALETNATLVPVGLIGTNRALRDIGGRRQRMELRFGEPISSADLTDLPAGAARQQLTERCMAAIQELTGQVRCAQYAPVREATPSSSN